MADDVTFEDFAERIREYGFFATLVRVMLAP